MNYQNYPNTLQAVSILQTVIGSLQILGGISSGLAVLILGVATFGIGLLFIPIPLVFFVLGILSLIAGIKGLQRNTSYGLSLGVGIAQMFLLLMCDFLSFGAGLTAVILLSQQEVKSYFGK